MAVLGDAPESGGGDSGGGEHARPRWANRMVDGLLARFVRDAFRVSRDGLKVAINLGEPVGAQAKNRAPRRPMRFRRRRRIVRTSGTN